MDLHSTLPDPDFVVPHVTPAPENMRLHRWLAEVRRNMLTLIPAQAYRQPISTRKLGPVRWHVLGAPSTYRHVFKDKLANYPKAPIMQRMLEPYLGQSVFMAHGDDWAVQRRALAPIFRPEALAQMADDMIAVADRTADRLLALARDGEAVPMSFEMRVLATEMVRHTMFKDLADQASDQAPDLHPDRLGQYRAGLQDNLEGFLHRFGRPGLAELLNIPDWALPWRLLRRSPTHRAREVLETLIAQRRAISDPPGDLLDLLLHVKMPDTGASMPDAQIRDNLMTFIVTGSDTSALALTWAIYVLTQQPEWAKILRTEVDLAAADEAPLSAPDQLPLLNAFLQEVMRVFPSAPLLVRKAIQADQIGCAEIHQGDLILAPIYALHRNPGVWDDPLLFDPRRFLGARKQDRWSYLPFGAGPRSCVAAGFALQETRLALATLIRHLDFALAPGWDVRPLMMLTLKPDGGLPIVVTKRTAPIARPQVARRVQLGQPVASCSSAGV